MYEQHFGFASLPFRVTPDPRIFYSNPMYEEAFATLRYGIGARKGFIVATGEVGTGKTTLLKLFMRGAPANVHTAYVFNPRLSFPELLRSVLRDLSVPFTPGDQLSLTKQLDEYLIRRYENGDIVALLLDEAQNLNRDLLEQLRLLSNLETDHDKLIQIVLMGQPELEERLEEPQLRQLKQRVALRCRLTRLKADEVRGYVEWRLRSAAYEGRQLFEPGAIDKIALYSAGLPRLINVVCDNALLLAFALSRTKITAELVDEAARDLKLATSMAFHGDAQSTAPSRPEIRHALPAPVAARRQRLAHRAWRNFPSVSAAARLAIALLLLAGALLYGARGRESFSLPRARTSSFVHAETEKLRPSELSRNALSASSQRSTRNTAVPTQVAMAPAPPARADARAGTAPSPPQNKKSRPAESRPTDRTRGAQAQIQPNPVPLAEEPQSVETIEPQRPLPADESSPDDTQKMALNEQRFFQGMFELLQVCLVFDRPERQAGVITTLPTRTWIRVERKDGNYLLVTSVNEPHIRGYVALEDASLERIGR